MKMAGNRSRNLTGMFFENENQPRVIAHRGYCACYPENTLASFRAAADAGAAMVELDVTLSRDREVVVIHDDHVNRTTSGSGLVGEFTLAELKKLDAGSWFHPRFSAERIPLLDEVMSALLPDTMINIEIKTSAFEEVSREEAIENQVYRLIRQHKAIPSVLVSSFEMRFLERLRSLDADVHLAWISETPIDRNTIQHMDSLKAYSWHPRERILTREQVDSIHDAGMRVFPWTANTRGTVARLMEMGVDGVITDDPVFIGSLV